MLFPPMEYTQITRVLANAKSILEGRAVHARFVLCGYQSNVYANNHLISMYLNSERADDARKVFDKMPERNLISWTTLISKFAKMGLSEEALDCFRSMVSDGLEPNHYTYVGAISSCTRLEAVRSGKEIHGRIYRTQLEVNSFVSNCLVNFYGKCGLLRSAKFVFDAILEPNLVAWGSLVSCYFQRGENEEGLSIFLRSLRAGVKANEFTSASVLGACAALKMLEAGMQVHSLVIKSNFRMDPFIVTGLVNFYTKCGELDLAWKAFWETERPDLSAWTALISGCVQHGRGKEAIGLFCKLNDAGVRPSEQTFASVLGGFADATEVEFGKQLHSLIIKLGFGAFTFVGNAVLDFYSKCGIFEESMKIFEDMDEHDTVTWNAMINGLVNLGHFEEAIQHFGCMLDAGFDPSLYTYSSILNICGDLPVIEWGKQTHCCIIKPGFDTEVVVGSALVDMYAKCGHMVNARNVFDRLPAKNTVSWNTMLMAYAQHGFGKDALEIYDMMQREGVKPNDVTFIGVLSACGHVGLLEEGLRHYNSMTKDYGINPRTDHLACVVSLYARQGKAKEAYDFIQRSSIKPDKVVWRCLLSSCKNEEDFALRKYAAENILSIDPDDTSAHITLSNIYAESKLWNEYAAIRKLMKEKELKKNTGYSWTELNNKIYSFSSGGDALFEGHSLLEVSSDLMAQLIDEGYVPDATHASII